MATANMGLTLATVGGSTGTWGTTLNTALTLIDAHDHQSGNGVRIVPGAMNINADLTFAGNAATNLKAVAFTAQASYTTARSLFVLSSDNELYYRSAGGTNIKITSGAGLNVSLVGGIAGDYAAASASLYYDDAAEAYRFLEAAPSPNDWSYVKAGGFDLYEHDSGIANFIGLRSPSALAASYSLTLPGALPGSGLLWQVDASGVITFSNTIASALTCSGLATFNAGATVPAGQTLTASGVVDFNAATSLRLPSRTLNLMANSGCQGAGTMATADNGTVTFTENASSLLIPIPLVQGDRISAISVSYARNSSGTLSFSLRSYSNTGSSVALATKTVSAGSGAATVTFTSLDSGSLPQTLGSDLAYYIRIAADNTDVAYKVSITYDHPT